MIRNVIKKICVSIAALIMCLGIAEVVTRLFSTVQPSIVERHPVIGKRYVPHFSGKVFVPEAGRYVDLRFTRDGFRGEDVPLQRAAGRPRIAVIGDSYVVAVAVDEDKTAVRQLEGMLRVSHPTVDWEVLNFGISSSSTGQELILHRELVADYQPSIVVCAYSMRNDFADNSSQLTHAARIYFELDPAGQLVQRPLSKGGSGLSVWLNRNSRFYVWQKGATAKAEQRLKRHATSVESGRWIFNSSPTEQLEDVWKLNFRLIEALNSEVEARGSEFVLALFPCAEQVDPGVWQDFLAMAGDQAHEFDQGYGEKRLVEFCAQRGIRVIPMASWFRDAHQEVGPLYFKRDGHFNDEGNRLAGELIHRYLTDGKGPAKLLGGCRA